MKKSVLSMVQRFTLLILSLVLMSCAHPTVPALNRDTAQPQLPGKFVWYDLFTTDLAAVEVFYRDLLGWEFAASDLMGAKVKTIKLNGAAIANAVEVELNGDQPGESRWLGYVSVADVDQAAGTVKASGGKIHTLPRQLSDRGRIAVCFDPQGAIFALLRSSTGDPPDADPVPNRLAGSELWTNDLEGAFGFYQAVTGYEVLPVALQNGDTYQFLAVNGRPRAGIAKILWEDVKPNWVPYIVVEDVAGIVAKAETLGGQLLLGERDGGAKDAVAILSDPAGGIFGVQQVWKVKKVQP